MSYDHVVEAVISGVLTGGATALTTVVGFFRDVKKRVTELEAKVGANDSHVGLMFQVHQLSDGLRTVTKEVEEWKNYLLQNVAVALPPMRPQMPTPRQSFLALSAAGVMPDPADTEERLARLEKQLKAASSKIIDFEDKLNELERSLDNSDQRRASELQKVREELAGVNGLMRGLASAVGLYGNDKR